MTMGRSDYGRTDMGGGNYADRLVVGADVYGADDEKIGTIADIGQNYFLVQKGWLFIKDLYLPTSAIARMDTDRVYLSVTKQEAETMGRDELPGTGDAWYGTQDTMATPDRTMGAGRTTGTAYADNDVDMTTNRATPGAGATTDREVRRDTNYREGENVNVPVVEEQLKAGVRETEAGRARIAKDVVEEQKTIDVPVEREEVYVTERAVNRAATQDDLGMMDRDIEIPLREQEVVTQKEAMVTGEVNVRKEVKRDTERVTDTVRREDVHVEDPNNPRVHVEGERGMTGTTGRTGMSGTTNTSGTSGATRKNDEGIIDRAKDAVREGEDKLRNR
jgi:uncharacterized protein (TIGR02271 family)